MTASRSLLGYRSIVYAGTLLTGMTGLIYQVVWQKYLSFIVGSEARSVALVVAVFLGGLAAGYRFWGRRTEKATSRRALLRVYGVVELSIGAYAAVFPFYLGLLRFIGHRGPASLVTDLLLTGLTLLLPTFLMGATIPLLVSVVPRTAEEVHLCHAKIYGINTLGACVGAFSASFFLIPRIGLDGSLLLAAAVNLAVGAVFIFNPLRDEVAKEHPIEPIPNRFDPGAVYFYVFVTGTVALSLEVLFIRVLGLTVGAGPHNFAIVVGVFIFGLAVGSLMLTGRRLSLTFLFRAIAFLLVYSMVLFHSVPYWPYWLNNARVSLRSIPTNYTVFLFVITGFLSLFLLPFLVPLGSMLPLAYSLVPKTATDYGKKCGRMYFYNTLGTAVGAVGLSYLLLYAVDLDVVFKIDVALLAALALYLLQREGRTKSMAVLGLLLLAFLAGPRWDRGSHYAGLFRFQEVNPYNFRGWFEVPQPVPDPVFFEDGPDTTVTVITYPRGQRVVPPEPGNEAAGPRVVPLISKGLVVNGKPDGDTMLDYSTITLAALVPYLYAPDRPDLRATVVGQGTGFTANVLGRAADVASTTVVEISSTLVKAAPEFDDVNGGMTTNPRVRILGTDGFKYFARLDGQLDIVVSATSPPWVQGVENLFTPEFYGLARDALVDDGVFMQWIPMYTIDAALFRSIVTNLKAVFPHLRLYIVSRGELGVLAAKAPVLDAPKTRRFDEEAIRQVRSGMTLVDIDLLELIRVYETKELQFLAEEQVSRVHTLRKPSLAYASDKLRFIAADIDLDAFFDVRLARVARYDAARGAAFARLVQAYPGGLRCSGPTESMNFLCAMYNPLTEAHRLYTLEPGRADPREQVRAYDLLRQDGVVQADPAFLARVVRRILDERPGGPANVRAALDAVFEAYGKDGLWDEAEASLSEMWKAGLIDPQYRDNMVRSLTGGREARDSYVNRYRGG